MRNEKESPNKFVPAVLAGAAAVSAITGVFGAISAGKQKRAAERRERKARERMKRLENIYANLDTSNPFENLENKFEDLTVNQQQAQFQAQQNQQQQANIMSNLAGAAGGSGIAALAQTLAQQGQIATQRASASIGQQEAMNQRLAAQQAARNQELEAKGVQIQQDKEMAKQGTLLGMEQSRVAAYMQQGQQAQQQKFNAITGTVSNLVDLGVAYAGTEND
tara:strand:+ start:35 stop:697 length:663 start_codon:yes stop_codon:yes gene_type:complete